MPDPRRSDFQFSVPRLGRPVQETVQAKPGFVLTTHKEYGPMCVECLDSLLPHLDAFESSVIDVYLNEPTQETERLVRAALRKAPAGCHVHVVVIEDQVANAILTGTWNQGTNYCLDQGCDVVLLMNHDIIVNKSLHHFVQVAARPDILGIVGPLMLCPHRMEWQDVSMGSVSSSVGTTPENRTEIVMVAQPKGGAVMGSFFAMNRQTLRLIKEANEAPPTDTARNYTRYFNENFPTGDNELDFANRWALTFAVSDAKGQVATPNYIVTSSMFEHGCLGTWTDQVEGLAERFERSREFIEGLGHAINSGDATSITSKIRRYVEHRNPSAPAPAPAPSPAAAARLGEANDRQCIHRLA